MKRKTAKERVMKYAEGGTTGDPESPLVLYKPKDTQIIKVKDNRKISPTTGKPFKSGGGKSTDVDAEVLKTIIAHAKYKGVDPYTALTIAWQETNFGKENENYGSAWMAMPDDDVLNADQSNQFANMLSKTLKDKLDYAKRLGYDKKGEDFALQAYNGYGKLKPRFPDSDTDSFYGVPTSRKNPIDMSKTPLYGQTIRQMRDEVLKLDPKIKALVDTTEAYKPKKMATGGTTGTPWAGIADSGLQLATGLMNIFENDPRAYSVQPTLNASTMRNMVTPYEHFANGGIYIKPENRGKFTKSAKGAGMGVQDYATKVLNDPNATKDQKKRARFAKNAAKWKHAMGGEVGNDTIEVEDDEIVETPNGQMTQMNGATHEQGGIDIQVPEGTKIYSDRLGVDGKTMQERKKKRERTLAKLEGLLKKSPTDRLLKGTLERTQQVLEAEDQQDMAIQDAVGLIYNAEGFATGGTYGNPVPQMKGLEGYADLLARQAYLQSVGLMGVTDKDTNAITNTTSTTPQKASTANTPAPATTANETGGKLSTGDYIGLGGNLFNAIAPILNTMNAGANRIPNVNRFQGFGADALEANDQAQGFAAGTRADLMTDIDSDTNAQLQANRNSAQSVNTVRALDIAAGLGRNKAKVAANSGYTAQMLGILGQRSGLENIQDQVVMSGQQQADVANQQDQDNYYSNMADNLVNFGTNIQGVGRSLNVAKANRVDSKLLSQLSKYGLGIDEAGNLINVR
jgi:hypothetical protein